MLALGTAADHIIVLALLLALLGLALYLFWRETRDRRLLLWMLLPVAAAFLLRLLCLDHVSGDYEHFLSRWVAFFRENGGFRAIAQSVGDYNVPYLYFLAAISCTRFPDLYAIKLFSILFDVLLAWGSLRLTRRLRQGGTEPQRDLAPAAAFALALLLPTVALNGSFWGQCDSLYAALAVHALALALEGKNRESTALLAVAFAFKLQTIFLIPLWGALWLAGHVKFKDLLAFPCACLLAIFPAMLLGKPLDDILGVYVGQLGEYGRLTLNAPSAYQFVPCDAKVNEGLLSALGIAAAFALALLLLAVGWRLRGRLDDRTAFLMGAALAIGVPFLLPHMHERYFFLADVLTLCWACACPRKGGAVCALAAGSSLLSYLVYLRLQYNMTVNIWGARFVMPLEAGMMLAALILTLRALAACVRQAKFGAKNPAPSGQTEDAAQ